MCITLLQMSLQHVCSVFLAMATAQTKRLQAFAGRRALEPPYGAVSQAATQGCSIGETTLRSSAMSYCQTSMSRAS